MKTPMPPKNNLEIEEVASFVCSQYENVQNITCALALAGRFVQITHDGSSYTVHIYSRI